MCLYQQTKHQITYQLYAKNSTSKHKNPSKQRFIAASARCSTKQLSSTITKCLKEIDTYHAKTGKKVYSKNGINSYWIIGNSSKVHRMIDRSNERKNVENIATYDFSTLYTNIPHDKLKKTNGNRYSVSIQRSW